MTFTKKHKLVIALLLLCIISIACLFVFTCLKRNKVVLRCLIFYTSTLILFFIYNNLKLY